MEFQEKFFEKCGYVGTTDVNENLAALVRRYCKNLIRIPEFQKSRTGAWKKAKKKEFIDTIRNFSPSTRAIGTIVLFSITTDPNHLQYVLDGQQRLNTLREEIQRDQSFYTILEQLNFPVQYREYENMIIASEWFLKVNQGTTLTPYEFNLVPLTVMDDYDRVICPQLEIIYSSVNNVHARFRYKIPSTRDSKHKFYRHSLLMFYEFYTGEGAGRGMSSKSSGRLSFEAKLANDIHTNKINLPDEIKKFSTSLMNTAALIETYLKEKQIGITAIRNLIEMKHWMTFHGYSIPDYTKLIVSVINAMDEKSKLRLEDGKTINLGLGSGIQKLKRYGKHKGLIKEEDKKRRKTEIQAKSGYQHHHPKAFSIYGEGKTEQIPSLLNLSKGNRE